MHNHDKIEHVFIRHYSHFLKVAYNICGERDLARDVLQDAFLAVLRSKETFKGICNVERYLTACIRNAAFRRLSKERRFKAMIHDFVGSEQNYFLENCIDWIRCRASKTILRERYLEKRTYQEIGDLYGASRQYIVKAERQAFEHVKIFLKYMV